MSGFTIIDNLLLDNLFFFCWSSNFQFDKREIINLSIIVSSSSFTSSSSLKPVLWSDQASPDYPFTAVHLRQSVSDPPQTGLVAIRTGGHDPVEKDYRWMILGSLIFWSVLVIKWKLNETETGFDQSITRVPTGWLEVSYRLDGALWTPLYFKSIKIVTQILPFSFNKVTFWLKLTFYLVLEAFSTPFDQKAVTWHRESNLKIVYICENFLKVNFREKNRLLGLACVPE